MIETYATALLLSLSTHAPAWPVGVAGSQIQHESAWKPTAMRRVGGEQGCGLAQVTRVRYPDGRVRFDALTEARNTWPQLASWSWDDCANVHMQLTFYGLYVARDYRRLGDVTKAVAAYNQGYGGVLRDMRLCTAKQGCDPSIWFGHVESTCGANAEACRVNRPYVQRVMRDAPVFDARLSAYKKPKEKINEQLAKPNPAGREVPADTKHGNDHVSGARALTVWERAAIWLAEKFGVAA